MIFHSKDIRQNSSVQLKAERVFVAKDEKMTSCVPLLQSSIDFDCLIAMQSLLALPPKLPAEFPEIKGTMATPLTERSVLSCVFSVRTEM